MVQYVSCFTCHRRGQAKSLTCVQDVWQDCNYTQLTVLTGLLQDVFTQDLRDKHLQDI